MNKKVLIMAVLLVAVLTFFGVTNSVMAANCTAENCAEECKGECTGEKCTVDCCPVKVGDKCYPTIQAAITAASGETTIELLKDISGPGFKVSGSSKKITIDFGGHTYDVTGELVGSDGYKTSGCQFLKDNTVTLKNGTLKSSTAAILVQNYSNLTVQDMTLDVGTTVSGTYPYALSLNNGNVSITGNTSIKSTSVAFDVYYREDYSSGAKVTVNTTGTISGKIEVKARNNKEKESQSELTIENINHEGKFDVSKELSEKITIKDGTYTESVAEYVKNGTAVAIKTGNTTKYYVGNDAKEAVENAESGSVVTVETGNLTVTSLPNGVIVSGNSTGAITVTNPSSSGSTASTLKSNLQALIAKAEGEGNKTEGLTNAISAAKAVLANPGATYGDLQQALASLQSAYNNFKNGTENNNQEIVSGNESNEAGDKGKLDEEPKMGESLTVFGVIAVSLVLAVIVSSRKKARK